MVGLTTGTVMYIYLKLRIIWKQVFGVHRNIIADRSEVNVDNSRADADIFEVNVDNTIKCVLL